MHQDLSPSLQFSYQGISQPKPPIRSAIEWGSVAEISIRGYWSKIFENGRITRTSKQQNGRITMGQTCQKGLNLKIFHQIWPYTTTIFEISTFSKKFRWNDRFSEKIWNLDPKTPKKSFLIAFSLIFSIDGRITRTSVKVGRWYPPSYHPHSRSLICRSFAIEKWVRHSVSN